MKKFAILLFILCSGCTVYTTSDYDRPVPVYVAPRAYYYNQPPINNGTSFYVAPQINYGGSYYNRSYCR